jgi:uracil-DNA glycosylase
MDMIDDDLAALLLRVRACRICRDAPAGGPDRRLPHEPRPVCEASSVAPVLIAGQAPGTRVHASGRPFTDPSGDRLRAWLGVDEAAFYDLRNFAIAPMGFCFPGQDAKGGDLPPRRECAPAWRDAVMAAMPQVRLVLAIGAHAQAWHLGPLMRRTLTETVSDWKEIVEATETTVTVLPLPHPSWRNTAWLKRHPFFDAELVPELQRRVRELLLK